MKRYVCTVAAGLLLALASTATASATNLPVLGQVGTQEVSFGDQTVGEQRNEADVTQAQGNGNLALSPAIAVFGDAETTNAQGNGNTANAEVDQENDVDQTQTSTQKQYLARKGDSCCNPSYDCKPSRGCEPKKGREACCEPGQSQTGAQRASFGDQTVEKQKNEADVTQKQGNGNLSVAPAFALGGGKHDTCNSTCEKSQHPSYGHRGGNAETSNFQGNGNEANAEVDQENDVDQKQASYQHQTLVDICKGLINR
jgi:hypothetical protein